MSGNLKVTFIDNSDKQYEHSADVIKFTSDKSYGKLYIGDKDSAAFLQLRSRNCAHVVNCQTDMHGLSREKDIKYHNCDPDATPNCYEAAFAFIDNALAKGKNVTVLCQTGLGRSAAVVIYYLMKKLPCSLAESHKLLTDARKNKTLNIKPDYINALIAEEKNLTGKVTVSMDGRKVVYLQATKKRAPGGGAGRNGDEYRFPFLPIAFFVGILSALYGILYVLSQGKA